MTPTLAHALKVLEEQTSDDPVLAEAVVFLAEEVEGPSDPFGAVSVGAQRAARLVNERRLGERRQATAASALDTAQVVALVGSINDRKGIDRRRRRGQLLGWRSGARTLHPDWQFDALRAETRPGLVSVIAALREAGVGAESADALMRAPRDDLGGRSLASLFASGQVDTVVRLIRSSADQS
ncbi:MAG: hypothetical protein M1134_03780 [Actinobacteria bacterium]|nr:hypothetical protein [Actinomycetota bacterium]MCL5444883.1 hypothetical protein [Actinomycetota bacterium]